MSKFINTRGFKRDFTVFELEFDKGKKIKSIGNVPVDNCQLLYINNLKAENFHIEEIIQHIQMNECLKIVLQHYYWDLLHTLKCTKNQ